ncbi:MAG: arginine deiminase family protein [Saprospiraceae bacterium]
MKVENEIALLKKVIIHKPDEGILRVSPKKSADLLFDDIVYLPAMQAEHGIFADVLRLLIGQEHVVDTQTLLEEALGQNMYSREKLIDTLVDYEELPKAVIESLTQKTDLQLAETLITGFDTSDERILFDPIPNFLFTRDIAVAINDHILITKAAKQARTRENFLTRFIVYNHALFAAHRKNKKIIDLNVIEQFPPSKKGEPVSMEGGDVMVLNKEFVLIGISERTNQHAFHSLKNYLFKNTITSNVVLFDIPSDRSFMHIDTIITQIDQHQFVGYKPIIQDGLSSYLEVHRITGETQYYATMKDFLWNEISADIKFVWSGEGESPAQEREQWTDGCNLLAIKPGVAITYDRNSITIGALQKCGYQIISAQDLLASQNSSIENCIITLPSAELSRARGGPHCMSCPLDRSAL